MIAFFDDVAEAVKTLREPAASCGAGNLEEFKKTLKAESRAMVAFCCLISAKVRNKRDA
jgi:hypothetical protein